MSFVYFARHRYHPLVKIGFSVNPRGRVGNLHAKLTACYPGGRPEERAEHERWAHVREYGEWFRDDPDLSAYIDAITPNGLHIPEVKAKRIRKNDASITLRVSRELISEADACVDVLSQPGIRMNQTRVLRGAIFQGLKLLRDELNQRPAETSAPRTPK